MEFGAKLDISVVNGWTRLEVLSFDAYNEATKLVEMIERHKHRTGNYPERVLADKIYRNVTISPIARNAESVSRFPHSDAPSGMSNVTKSKIIWINANVWKWNAGKTSKSANAASAS